VKERRRPREHRIKKKRILIKKKKNDHLRGSSKKIYMLKTRLYFPKKKETQKNAENPRPLPSSAPLAAHRTMRGKKKIYLARLLASQSRPS